MAQSPPRLTTAAGSCRTHLADPDVVQPAAWVAVGSVEGDPDCLQFGVLLQRFEAVVAAAESGQLVAAEWDADVAFAVSIDDRSDQNRARAGVAMSGWPRRHLPRQIGIDAGVARCLGIRSTSGCRAVQRWDSLYRCGRRSARASLYKPRPLSLQSAKLMSASRTISSPAAGPASR